MGAMSWSASAFMCSGRSRRASSPPCTVGCKVFTRPSSISGKCVTSLTSRTLTPAERRAFAVPPVESRSQPRSVRALAKSTRPVLSDTERSAVGISGSNSGFQLLEDRDHLYHPRIHDMLDGEHFRRERLGVVRSVYRH